MAEDARLDRGINIFIDDDPHPLGARIKVIGIGGGGGNGGGAFSGGIGFTGLV